MSKKVQKLTLIKMITIKIRIFTLKGKLTTAALTVDLIGLLKFELWFDVLYCNLGFFDRIDSYSNFCIIIKNLPLRKKCPYSELFWSAFSYIRTECGETLRISSYSVWMRENADQNNSEYVHFSCSVLL